MVVDFHRILLTHALERSARPLFTREKVPTDTSVHSVILEPTTLPLRSRDEVHLLSDRGHSGLLYSSCTTASAVE